MKYYSYVIKRDFGFAPNPYFGYCTLATCKPIIRRTAQKGDWVALFGASGTKIKRKLVALMQVDETLSFDEYWEDKRFIKKRPDFSRAAFNMYGDNIYHHVDNKWFQEPSHHSCKDGSINYNNLNHDTKTDRVLIAKQFFYFGNNAVDVPDKFSHLIGEGRGHRVCDDERLIEPFIDYVSSNYTNGINGVPYSRKSGGFAHYKGER